MHFANGADAMAQQGCKDEVMSLFNGEMAFSIWQGSTGNRVYAFATRKANAGLLACWICSIADIVSRRVPLDIKRLHRKIFIVFY
jgi:hypothetical protein